MRCFQKACVIAACVSSAFLASADENLFGYVRGSETLPAGGWELYNIATSRDGKGTGSYHALDDEIELEYGWTDSFTVSAAVSLLAVQTSGISIDGYLPGGENTSLRYAGVEITGKYSILRPAADDIGLALRFALESNRLDPHSSEDKDETEFAFDLILQKYFMDGQVVWVANTGMSAAYELRAPIAGLPPTFEWETEPEVEIGLKAGTGITYRFVPNWFIGAEAMYETEFETEVGQERWSLFAGPSLHYGGQAWWATLTWFPQLSGGGETYPGQPSGLHLIEKTEVEYRLKLGFNF